ncbi:MAG: Uma2 family endonuclease [Hyphomicrobium sp.]|nr:Uma2 family endonuclease [Hyphomicrobium sp.]
MTGFAEDPQSPFTTPMDKVSFLRWVETQEGRYELARGVVEMQARVTRGHALVANAIARELAKQLNTSEWTVLVEGFGVDVGDGVRYPDVLVERAGGDAADLTTDKPIVIVEVLSPSSEDLHLQVKSREYTTLPALHAYLVASQDTPRVWLWIRDPLTGRFQEEAAVLAGSDARIEIPELDLVIPLHEINRGLTAL